MNFLGHKRIDNALLYIQLAEVIFEEQTIQFTSKEACELISAGFEYVCDKEGVKLFRRLK